MGRVKTKGRETYVGIIREFQGRINRPLSRKIAIRVENKHLEVFSFQNILILMSGLLNGE